MFNRIFWKSEKCFILVNLSSSTAVINFPSFKIQAEESGWYEFIPKMYIDKFKFNLAYVILSYLQ